jgi:ribosomal protein S18 acetylase RimI-like enzyme
VPEVRDARGEDAEGVARVHVSVWQAAYRGILPADFLAGLRWEDRYEFWRHQLAEPSVDGGRTLVLVDGARVLGFASTGPARDEDRRRADAWELYAIYVVPDLWGQGWGQALAEAALDAVPAVASDVSLWVLADNDRARRFYERLGFAPDGQRQVIALGGRDVAEVRYLRVRGTSGG